MYKILKSDYNDYTNIERNDMEKDFLILMLNQAQRRK